MSTTSNNTISISRANDRTEKITVSRNGVPVDITGWKFFFTVKKKLSDTDDEAVIKKDVLPFGDPADGIAYIVIDNEDTDIRPYRYRWDLKIKDAADKLRSSRIGWFEINNRVTERSS